MWDGAPVACKSTSCQQMKACAHSTRFIALARSQGNGTLGLQEHFRSTSACVLAQMVQGHRTCASKYTCCVEVRFPSISVLVHLLEHRVTHMWARQKNTHTSIPQCLDERSTQAQATLNTCVIQRAARAKGAPSPVQGCACAA